MSTIVRRIAEKIWWECRLATRLSAWPDDRYLKLNYFVKTGKRLRLNCPESFTEKLQWLKLNYRFDVFTTMVDKYRAKDWVSERIGADHVVRNLAVWNSVDDIDISLLPDRFVLKTNHDSGGVAICADKASFDIDNAKMKLQASMDRNYFYSGREWPYKNVEKLVFAEEYIGEISDSGDDWSGANEYDFFCFDGEPRFMSYCHGDKTDSDKRYNDYFDCSFRLMDVTCGCKSCGEEHTQPELLEEMLSVAKKLSSGVPFLRVDLFVHDGRVLVGELTFYPWGGFMRFTPKEYEYRFGTFINLPVVEN